jgi:acetyl esterase/lipase
MHRSFVVIACLLFACCCTHAQTNLWQPSIGHIQIPIWPGTPPDAHPAPGPEYHTNETANLIGGKGVDLVYNVSQPTMTVYSPKGDKNTGAAVIVFPGGGYQILAIDLEGTEICDWLNSKGITAVLLKYRVPNHKEGPYGEAPMALADAQRTISLVRSKAANYRIAPNRIGVIGFSAGGHLVAATSTQFKKRSYAPVDAADKQSCRPDFAIACYPGHMWNEETPFELNPHITVTTNTPPTFIVQAEDDPTDSVNHSLIYYTALKKANVPAEMHLFAHGGHAFGVRPTKNPVTHWPTLAETWLRTIGMISD